MAGVCSDNRFEIIAKVKEHLIKATNIEMQPEELKQADNILFRLWQLGYFKQIEATYKVVEENKEAKEIIKELLFTSNELDENTRSKAEQFLKECK